MGMIIKKRQLILATLIVALGAAVFVNWYYTKPKTTMTDTPAAEVQTTVTTGNLGDAQLVNGKTNDAYFTNARVNRTTSHDEALEALNDIIKDSSSSAQAVSDAQKKLNEISENIKRETDLENLIKAKISGECIVIINDGKVQVVVNKNTLNDTVSTQIMDIIVSQMNISSENITLIEAK